MPKVELERQLRIQMKALRASAIGTGSSRPFHWPAKSADATKFVTFVGDKLSHLGTVVTRRVRGAPALRIEL